MYLHISPASSCQLDRILECPAEGTSSREILYIDGAPSSRKWHMHWSRDFCDAVSSLGTIWVWEIRGGNKSGPAWFHCQWLTGEIWTSCVKLWGLEGWRSKRVHVHQQGSFELKTMDGCLDPLGCLYPETSRAKGELLSYNWPQSARKVKSSVIQWG